ncbi:MAG: glucose-6-phosphate isomerase [Sulfurovum sp.]|nr:glucose-6-phosphate isomerase [Sulfurovum sp.]
MLKFKENRSFYADAYDEGLVERAYRIVKNEKESGDIGYYTLPSVSRALIGQLQAYEKENAFLENIETVVVIGIGGSSLGAKAVDSMLKHKKKRRRKLLFFENFDPLTVIETMGQCHKEHSLFICISKSGGTIETISTFKTILNHFAIGSEREDSKRLMVITDKGSPLSRFAQKYNIKEFHLPMNVVGRFSVLSAVGIIPLYLAGYDVHALLDGAEAYKTIFFEGKSKEILQKACFMFKNRDRYTMNLLFVYANALEDFAKWYVQLWAESLGKIDAKGEKAGLTPIGLTGSADQHSFLQLILEGPENKTVTFLTVEDFENDLSIPPMTLPYIEETDFMNGRGFGELINAQCDATMESIANNNIPTDKITLPKLNEKYCGALIIYFEILTSLVGAMSEVNTYDQPGVELGKMILKEKFKD